MDCLSTQESQLPEDEITPGRGLSQRDVSSQGRLLNSHPQACLHRTQHKLSARLPEQVVPVICPVHCAAAPLDPQHASYKSLSGTTHEAPLLNPLSAGFRGSHRHHPPLALRTQAHKHLFIAYCKQSEPPVSYLQAVEDPQADYIMASLAAGPGAQSAWRWSTILGLGKMQYGLLHVLGTAFVMGAACYYTELLARPNTVSIHAPLAHVTHALHGHAHCLGTNSRLRLDSQQKRLNACQVVLLVYYGRALPGLCSPVAMHA